MKRNIYWSIMIGVILVIIIVFFVIWLSGKNKVNRPALSLSNQSDQFDQKDITTNQNSNTAGNQVNQSINSNTHTSNSNTSTSQAPSADDYYNNGLKNIAAQNYSKAIDDFTQAIALNPHEPNYYSKKAEAEVWANKKQNAIATVQTGLATIPNDPNLENQLNILQTVVK